MARELSLLDRLRRPDLEDRRSVDTDPAALTRSILLGLERLLNSRQGGAAARPDFGIPSIEDLLHGGPELTRELAVEIQKSIEAFEPRLQNTRVRVLPRTEAEPTLLRFEIQAEMVTGGRKSRVRFETRVDNDGRLVVRD